MWTTELWLSDWLISKLSQDLNTLDQILYENVDLY